MGNWSADKTSYTATSGLVAILGNWSSDRTNYVNLSNATGLFYPLGTNPLAFYNSTNPQPGANASWNQSLATTLYYPLSTNPLAFFNTTTLSSISGNIGNWSADKTNYQNHTTEDSIYVQNSTCAAGSVAQNVTISGNQCIPTLTTTQINTLGNWSSDRTNYVNYTVNGNLNMTTYNITSSTTCKIIMNTTGMFFTC
jgi:hypothetical protein